MAVGGLPTRCASCLNIVCNGRKLNVFQYKYTMRRLVLIIITLICAEPSSAQNFDNLRERMVRDQIIERGITNRDVLRALREVPRHEFVPADQQRYAYADRPLPIGFGQTISQPFIVAYMTELLSLKPDDRVLEIGTGSGYQAAILAEIVSQVYSIEIVPELAERASRVIEKLEYKNVEIKQADGYYGWEEHAPFDAIVVTAASEHIPPPLIDQLADSGRMVIPVGSPFMTQSLMLVEKRGEKITTRSVAPVRFVPFTRDR